MGQKFYETLKKVFVVKRRMAGYNKREKFKEIFDKTPSGGKRLKAMLPVITAPKALVMEIYYPESDYEYPIEFQLPTQPGVVLKEVCVETGKVFAEFRVSLEEAQAIGILLKENLAKSSGQ